MKPWSKLTFVFVTMLIAGCTANFPFDPANAVLFPGDSFKSIQEDIEDFLADPFGVKPFPVIVGGDSERIYYATNLTDVKINFPGPTNDLVLPGYYGPSNLYKYEDGERAMMRALAPSAVFGGTATDGVYAAYVKYPLLGANGGIQVVVCDMYMGEPSVLYDSSASDPNMYVGDLALSAGRAAFVMGAYEEADTVIRVLNAADGELVRDIEVGWWSTFDLDGDLLAYTTEPDDKTRRLYLLDLSSEDDAVLLAELPATRGVINVYITNNKVVWSESDADFTSEGVKAYDIPSGVVHVWTDAIAGRLTGAADNYYLTEEYVIGDNDITSRIVIRLREVGGDERKLADFRADGLAGQSCILGDRAVFVNPDRRVVVAPLDGGDRVNFRPF